MRGRVTAVALGLATAAVLAGCGGGGTSSAASGGAAGTDAPAGSVAAAGAQQGTTVDVKATEYKLTLAATHFAPGTYTFTMTDDGHATHAIALDGPGVDNKSSETAGPGGTSTLTVTLQPGTYQLYCPVGNHRAEGMQTTLTVG